MDGIEYPSFEPSAAAASSLPSFDVQEGEIRAEGAPILPLAAPPPLRPVLTLETSPFSLSRACPDCFELDEDDEEARTIFSHLPRAAVKDAVIEDAKSHVFASLYDKFLAAQRRKAGLEEPTRKLQANAKGKFDKLNRLMSKVRVRRSELQSGDPQKARLTGQTTTYY